MKVIFLDNDGVICLSNNWGSRFKKETAWKKTEYVSSSFTRYKYSDIPISCQFDNFDKKAIKILNDILNETGAEIVVSSDWKLHATLDQLGDYYLEQGISKRPIAFTPQLRDFDPETAALFSYKCWLERSRCLEIKKWLEDNSVEKWVSVDDLNMSNEFLQPGLDNFVLTPISNEGIKQSGIKDKIIKYLND